MGDGETGPNTGGMGAYSPVPAFPPAAQEAALDRIIRPALAEMARRGTPFRGVLYAGLMLTEDGAEADRVQRPLRRSRMPGAVARGCMSDLLPALQAACDGELAQFDLRWYDAAAIVVVMAARGYPDAPERGSVISGLERAAAVPDVQVFHAGTDADTQGGSAPPAVAC